MSRERLPTMELAREAGLPVFRFPKTQEEKEIAQDALAKDLSKLSVDQQEQILFDVHDISTFTNDSDDDHKQFVADPLREFEKEIDKISKKDAYKQALFLNPGYVCDNKFRLLFLRAAEFRPRAAADMMVKHFEVKRELFGDGEVLAREVRQSDLSPGEMAVLRLGVSQILPVRDASGRSVMMINPSADGHSISNMEDKNLEVGRSIFYMNTAALRDEQVRKEGIVWVIYTMGNPLIEDFSAFEWITRVDGSVPIISIAGHICFDSNILRPFIAGYQLFTNKRDRHRLRSHFGSLEEVNFQLQTYGIPTDVSPMRPDGTWSKEYHQEWLQAQRLLEESSEQETKQCNATDSIVVIPRRFDVLFGKNSRARLATGTQRALHLVEMYRDRYERANKFEKTDLAEKIISLIHESGGRFLKQDSSSNCCWVQVHDTEARKKVAHWFRHARSKSKQHSQKEQDAGLSKGNNGGTRTWETLISDVTAGMARPFKRVSPS